MMPMLDCEAVADLALVERYLAKRLTAEELESFEAHFLTCDRCQDAIALGAGIRGAWPRLRSARPRRAGLLLGGSLGLAAAAGLAAVLLRTPGRVPDPLTNLGKVIQSPLYLGIPVRAGPPGTADSLFDAAMLAYVGEHYDQAVVGLRAALAAGVDAAPADFFLATSLLMIGKPAAAAADFAKVIALGDTPYLAEAHFYRAKALLVLGQTAPALDELHQAAELGGVIGPYARALSDSVVRILRR